MLTYLFSVIIILVVKFEPMHRNKPNITYLLVKFDSCEINKNYFQFYVECNLSPVAPFTDMV